VRETKYHLKENHMEHKEYVATMVSRMRYNPQTAEEILTMKEFLLAEFLEQDALLNDLLIRWWRGNSKRE
jgi:hypothetical protein